MIYMLLRILSLFWFFVAVWIMVQATADFIWASDPERPVLWKFVIAPFWPLALFNQHGRNSLRAALHIHESRE